MAKNQVTYRNKKTGNFVTYARPNPRLDKSENWERVKSRKQSAKKTDDSKPTS
ncbi:MAG: hypothetical protein ACLFWR_13285 [Acidimicrobiales bacterium]